MFPQQLITEVKNQRQLTIEVTSTVNYRGKLRQLTAEELKTLN